MNDSVSRYCLAHQWHMAIINFFENNELDAVKVTLIT